MAATKCHRKFENCCRDSTILQKSVCWTCINRFLLRNFQNVQASEFESENVTNFLNILKKHDCSNKEVLYRILEFCFRWHFYKCECEDKDPEMVFMNAIMKPLRTLRSNRETNSSRLNLKDLPICTINVQLMLVLSKYGIHMGKSVFNVKYARRAFASFLQCIQEHEGLSSHSTIKELSNFAKSSLNNAMKAEGQFQYVTSQRGKRYIFLIIRTLHAIELSLDGSLFVFNFVKCFSVFYRTIRDPFVSQEDMKEFLCILWRILPFKSNELAKITEIFTRLYINDIPKLYCPRSLKHLCRISIRYRLRKNSKMLPYSVRRLRIPRDLHDYLLCLEPINI